MTQKKEKQFCRQNCEIANEIQGILDHKGWD